MKKSEVQQRKGFILDGSVALAWCFRDEQDAYAIGIAERLPQLEPVVPQIWRLEVANGMLMGERRKRCEQTDTANWTWFLERLPIVTDDRPSIETFDAVLRLAREHNLKADDASYLELAIRRGLPLATLDKELIKAAKEAGVKIFMP